MKHKSYYLKCIAVLFVSLCSVSTECIGMDDIGIEHGNNIDSVSEGNSPMIIRLAVIPVVKKSNGLNFPRMPRANVEIYYDGDATLYLRSQFGNAILILQTTDGEFLYQTNIPQDADDIYIPTLPESLVEIHINDGENDYYGYLE